MTIVTDRRVRGTAERWEMTTRSVLTYDVRFTAIDGPPLTLKHQSSVHVSSDTMATPPSTSTGNRANTYSSRLGQGFQGHDAPMPVRCFIQIYELHCSSESLMNLVVPVAISRR